MEKGVMIVLLFTFVLVTSIGFVLAGIGFGEKPQLAPTTEGLVAYYPFDGDALDDSGNENHGTIYGEPTLIAGKVGSGAYEFDGDGDYIEVMDDDSLDFTKRFTLAGWFYFDTDADGEMGIAKLITKEDLSGNFAYSLTTLDVSNNLGGPQDVLLVKIKDELSTSGYAHTSIADYKNQWVHLATTFNGSDLKIYINGQDENALQQYFPRADIVTNTADIGIGATQNGDFPFKGKMDELRLYDRNLTDLEIRTLAGICGNNIVEAGEQCDDGNVVDGDGCSSACIVEGPCHFTSASWSTENAVEGTTVSLIVTGNNNCNGKNVNFEVWEEDNLDEDELALTDPDNMVFLGTTTTTTWTAEWQCDGDIGNGLCVFGEPEYYFNAILVSNTGETISSGSLLIVSEFPPTCGNEVVQGSEQCDDGSSGSQLCSVGCTFTTCGDEIIQNPNGEGVNEICELVGDPQSCTTAEGYPGTRTCDETCESFNPCIATGAVCGNGILEPGEDCDDNNNINGDGCSSICEVEIPCTENWICDAWGDCIEEIQFRTCVDDNICDPDNSEIETSRSCVLGSDCGNGILEPGEDCDDGNDNDLDSCTSSCISNFCGDGVCNNDETIQTCEIDCALPGECTTNEDCPLQINYFCSENEEACTNTIQYVCLSQECVQEVESTSCTAVCENGCSDGDCLPGGEGCETGCEWKQGCIPHGLRVAINTNKSVLYCDIDGQLARQKANKKLCENNYECISDNCLEGICKNKALSTTEASTQAQTIAPEKASFPVRLFKSIGCWFRNPFSKAGRQSCLIS